MDYKKKNWEESYRRGENHIFYPKEQVVKFLNRFIRKKIEFDKFKDLQTELEGQNALDLGCGIGRQTVLLKEFGFNAYGLDISEVAIGKAKFLTKALGYPELEEQFKVLKYPKIPYPDKYFKIAICDSVLDSMNFKLAKSYIEEIERVTKDFVYLSLISDDYFDDSRNFREGMVVSNDFEEGTIQNFFNWDKIEELINATNFKIIFVSLQKEEFLVGGSGNYGRYHLVLSAN